MAGVRRPLIGLTFFGGDIYIAFPFPLMLLLMIAPLVAARFGRRAFLKAEACRYALLALLLAEMVYVTRDLRGWDSEVYFALLTVFPIPTVAGVLILWFRGLGNRPKPIARGFEVLVSNAASSAAEEPPAAMDRPRVERSGNGKVGRRGAGH